MPDSNQEKLFGNSSKDQDTVLDRDSDQLEETPEIARAMSDPEFERLESVLGPVEARRRLGLESDPEVPSEPNSNQLEMIDDDSETSETQAAEGQPEKGEELYRHVIKKPEKPENAYQGDDGIDYRYRIEMLLYVLDLYDDRQDELGDQEFLDVFGKGEKGEPEVYLETFQRAYGGTSNNAVLARQIYRDKLKEMINPKPKPNTVE